MRKRHEIESAFAPTSSLAGRREFYLVGIGGAGMSALARMLTHRGYEVTGVDSTTGLDVRRLEGEGISVRIGHSGEAIRSLGSNAAIVLTDAIDLDASPEVAEARQRGLPLFRRSQVLGWILRDRKVIAVTGTHGKTTTTGMIGSALIRAGLDPTVVVGAVIPQFGGPVREGNGEWAVVEACEAYDSFHDLQPHDVVLTNLEMDHGDFHGDFDHLQASVRRFVESMPSDGTLVYCEEDSGAAHVAQEFRGNKRGYHLNGQSEAAIRVFGRHNRLNMAGALEMASLVGAHHDEALAGVSEFQGAERRLQIVMNAEVAVIDDYAHHPTEVAASLEAVRGWAGNRRVVVVFQPHLYSRTADNIEGFAHALDAADLVVLTDIYPAREAPIPGISSARIAELLRKPVHYCPSRHRLPMEVAALLLPGDVVVTMGAGNIQEVAPRLIAELDRPPIAARLGRPVRRTKVAVILGGDSAEREVSLLSGHAVAAALTASGFSVAEIDVTELLLKQGVVTPFVGADRPDVAFLAVHGTRGEDGAMQGFLELLGIPYTGSGIQASAIAMDKELTKAILGQHGITTPRGVRLPGGDVESLNYPLVVKPNAQGSTVGLAFVDRPEDLDAAIARAFFYDDSVLVEERIIGMEISTPVVCNRALIPVEIAPTSGFYDFASKYTPGATQEICPARLPDHVLEAAKSIALRAHRALGCEGPTRTDAIVRDGEVFVLEVNTLPGMTGTSLLPNSALASGISFEELCTWLVEDALERSSAQT